MFYTRKINIGKHKYVFMCDFDILSQGHALTNYDNLADFSLKIENNPHKWVQLPYLHCFMEYK